MSSTDMSNIVTAAGIESARSVVMSSGCVRVTPVLSRVQDMFQGLQDVDLYLKLENMQQTGSFKIRGVVYQMSTLPEGYGTKDRPLVSMSAGNYGKAFAYMCHRLGYHGCIMMPDTAPDIREEIIKGYGVDVERHPVTGLQSAVDKYVQEKNALYLHSYDDPGIITGHASLGLELAEQVPDADVVLVCLGGGGLISGVASALRLCAKSTCRIYGVEPEGSRTMFESFKAGKAVGMASKSIASGLSPPYAGKNCYLLCKKFVEEILLVTDEELVAAMKVLYDRGLVVEPSGAAAFAAVLHHKVVVKPGEKVVVVLTGGNTTPDELLTLIG